MHSFFSRRFIPITGLFTFLVGMSTTGCDRGYPINIGSDPCDPSACGTAPDAKYPSCADGTQAGPTGQCIKTSDGSCAWEYSTCATTCKLGDSKPSGDGCNQCSCTASGEWACTKMACGNDCTYQGALYADGSTFESAAGCCQCSSGFVKCSTAEIACPVSCEYDGKTYAQGTGFPATDGCNQCSCSFGQVTCTSGTCPVPNECDKTQCGAIPDIAAYTCVAGSTAGFTGRCLRQPDDTCSWEIIDCPFCKYQDMNYAYGESFAASDGCNKCTCDQGKVVCTALACPNTNPCNDADCGSRPKCATYQCADGSMAGCTDYCIRAADGTCGWEIRECPATCKEGEQVTYGDSCKQCTCAADGTWACSVLDPALCNTSCVYEGSPYASGTQFAAGGGCCKCTNGKVDCVITQMLCQESCIYNGQAIANGESFAASDGCNKCTCDTSKVICTTDSCQDSAPCKDTECGPVLDCGTIQCSDGSIAGCTNKCQRAADGTCSREVLSCPAVANPNSACTPGVDQTCDGELLIRYDTGKCLNDGTCECSDLYIKSSDDGKCYRWVL